MTAAQVARTPGLGHARRGLVRAVAIVVAAMALAATVLTGAHLGTPTTNRSAGASMRPHPLEAAPAEHLAVGALALDGAVSDVRRQLGPPDSAGPDIDGTALAWHLAGADVTVTEDAGGRIAAITAVVTGEGLRPALDHDVVLGRTSLADVVARWGEPAARSTDAADDYVVAYDACRAGAPVVVKFDQAAGHRAADQPVTRVVVAYADEPGC